MPRALLALALLALTLPAAGACATTGPSAPSTLPATLSYQQTPQGAIAVQDGIAVPSFSPSDRPTLDLSSGDWRFQAGGWDGRRDFDRRDPGTLAALTLSAAGREAAGYDDSGWARISVPGTFNPPPQGGPTAGWYRFHFTVPLNWAGFSPTLKFGAANYLADVWLNGHYLGYHEGGQTPFAFDASRWLDFGGDNVLAVHVVDPPSGEREDIVPWALIDWWRYGGLTQPVWLERTPSLSVARADIRPHLDAADVSLVVENRSAADADATLHLEVLPAAPTAANLLNPDPASLLVPEAQAIVSTDVTERVPAHGAVRVGRSFSFAHADLWSPQSPALLVFRAALSSPDSPPDQLTDSFGLRQVNVDPNGARVLLNGEPTFLTGVAIHDEQLEVGDQRYPTGHPITTWAGQLAQLEQARRVHANLVRADHTPANPMLLTLADRLGLAVWEEIPLYHFRPPQFQATFARGIPQQMLAEMDLRDFNHPSVLFHGLANESSGDQEREAALDQLLALDRRLDGSRLVGQASYGSPPGDRTSEHLDVAGYTFYYGVFYGGSDIGGATAAAVDRAHQVLPRKPVLILEFGHWADTLEEEAQQTSVLERTLPPLESRADTHPSGFVAGVVWWSLDDYWSDLPGIAVEHFGLFRPDGSARPVTAHLAEAYAAAGSPAGGGSVRPAGPAITGRVASPPAPEHLLLFLGYGAAAATGLLVIALLAVLGLRRAPAA